MYRMDSAPLTEVVGSRTTYLTAKEVAKLLNLSLRAVENMRAVGRGPPFYRWNKWVRYDVRDLEAWIASKRVV